MLFGPLISAKDQELPSSVAILHDIYSGAASSTTWVPPQYSIDVRDAATLHIAALIYEDVYDSRLFAASTPFNIPLILELLSMLYPRRARRGMFEIEEGVEDQGVDMTFFREASRAELLLRRVVEGKESSNGKRRRGFIDLECSLKGACDGWV